MENVIAAVKNINWALLRRQKREVCRLDESFPSDARDGVLALLDSIQDAYVADGMATARQVFGTRLVEVRIPIYVTAVVSDVSSVQDAILVGWGDHTFDWELKLSEDSHDYHWEVSDAMLCDATNLATGEETDHQMHDAGVEIFQRGHNSYELKYYAFINVEIDHAESAEDAINIAMNLEFTGEMKAHSKHCTELSWEYSNGVESAVYYEGEELDKYEMFTDDFFSEGEATASSDDEGSFIVSILQHDIKCFLRDDGDVPAPTELDDSSIEHITRMIKDDYREGELVVSGSEGNEWRGWWSFIKS